MGGGEIMNIGSFSLDAKGASIEQTMVRDLNNGNKIKKLIFDNGLILIFTETNYGIQNIDFNYVMIKEPNGTYYADLNNKKSDFNDYFDQDF